MLNNEVMQTDTIGEVKGKLEQNQQEEPETVTFPLVGVPIAIHRKLKIYQSRMADRLGRTVKIDEAYIMFLNEKVQEIQ